MKGRDGMKKFVRYVAALACIFAISLSMIVSAVAAAPPEGDSIQASDYIISYTAWAVAGSGGKVYIYYNIDATRTWPRVGVKLMVVQMQDAGTWTPVQTTTGTLSNGLLLSNDSSHAGSWVYSGTVGNTYRAVVTVYAGPVSGGDSRIITTNSVVARP